MGAGAVHRGAVQKLQDTPTRHQPTTRGGASGRWLVGTAGQRGTEAKRMAPDALTSRDSGMDGR